MDPVLDTSAGPHHPSAPMSEPVARSNQKPLWAAVGVLTVAVAALGGTLLWQNVHEGDGAAAQQQMAAGAPGQVLIREDVMSEQPAQVASAAPSAPLAVAPQAARPVVSAPAAAPRAQNGGYTGSYAHEPVASRTPVCADCGRIESVTPVQQAAPATGIGAVAGGVLGAVVGNQIGGGSGRTAATLLGAGGGAYLGHNVEKRTRTTTSYQVRVRMDNGNVRTFYRSAAPAVGERVTVEGNSYRMGEGRSYSTQPAQSPYYQSVSEPQGTYSTARY